MLAVPLAAFLSSCSSYVYHGGSPEPSQATPVITWPEPAAISADTPLGSAQLDATANVPGTFVYTPAAGTLLAAGTHLLSVTFTPRDTAAYTTATASVALVVNPSSTPVKVTPQITWVPPTPIFYPQPLGPEQLDAIQSVAGTFTYDPPAGTVLSPGAQTLTALFKPSDTTDYTNAKASVTLTVNPVPPPPSCPQPNGNSVHSNAHLAVSDTDNSRVLIFDAPFTSGECAGVALGQAQFYYTDSLQPMSASALYEPIGMAMDAAGNLYVADYNVSGRVMQFHPPFSNGMKASLELGKPNFNAPGDFNGACAFAPTDRSLCMPAGVTIDSKGNLWVSDTWNGRIVEYQPPIQMAMPASLEIGQPDVNTGTECDGIDMTYRQSNPAKNMTAREFCIPLSTVFDSEGDLWVTDPGNARILEFRPPFSNGMAASLELGFPAARGLTAPIPTADCTKAPTTSDSTFCGPGAIAFDAHGNLWVADGGNNRLLQFSPPFSNGMAASLVIGQTDFTARSLKPPAADTFNDPAGLAIDNKGDLIVADWLNNRALIFVPPFASGMSARVVLGQSDMSSGVPHGCGNVSSGPPQFGYPSEATLCHPQGVVAF